MPFFRALEEEIVKAKMNDKVLDIQLDANSKLGPEWISGGPHKQTSNAKIFSDLLKINELFVINGIKTKCVGKITRRRITRKVKAESIIDFVIGYEDMVQLIDSLTIDEDYKYCLRDMYN